jgi:hypothetical protein
MRVVFYTSGITGSGRVVRGICIGNALRRANIKCKYIILNNSNFSHLADIFSFDHIEIPVENEDQLSKINFPSSIIYKTLETLNPDVLIVDLLWFNLHHFIHELTCKKIFLCHWVVENFFYVPLNNKTIYFQPEDYDRLYAIEPFRSKFPFDEINPIIIRNREEILSREKALRELKLSNDKKNCLYAFNGNPEDFEKHKKKYSYLSKENYHIVYTTNYQGGLFPVVDYYNAFDLVICAAGYNQFWEARYFNKKAIFENVPLRFSSTERRIKKFSKYTFKENGADQLIDIILKL